jgi:hypothetical protein
LDIDSVSLPDGAIPILFKMEIAMASLKMIPAYHRFHPDSLHRAGAGR